MGEGLTVTIEPNQGVVLVSLSVSEFGDIPVPEKSHDSLTYGEVVMVHHADKAKHGYLIGRRAYWRKYKDDARIPNIKDKLALIEINDIMGTSWEENN